MEWLESLAFQLVELRSTGTRAEAELVASTLAEAHGNPGDASDGRGMRHPARDRRRVRPASSTIAYKNTLPLVNSSGGSMLAPLC